MKIIFLDIDGVLNDLDYIHKIYPEKCAFSKKNNINKCLNYKMYLEYVKFNFNPENLKVLKTLCDMIECKIVLTSSFRCKEVIDALTDLGFPVIGMTNYINQNRYLEIIDYLNNNDVENFVILDDENKYLKDTPLENNLVQTSLYDGGLKDFHIEKAISILNQRSR